MHNRLKISNTHWTIIKESLNLITSFIFKEISDYFCFHTFAHN